MLTQEDLQAIRQIIQEETAPIKESLAEVRDATNYIADWVEQVEKKVDTAI